ncbi:MAG: PolC-type DNA polymerase III, partial [Lachnospiraceae bacterium]|nr:PolC-type DNA polymerase III [Lachnospiraceae bacterium]
MEKKFFEAFPNLNLDGVQKDLFEQVVVERITATRRKDLLRIYIRSERLIEKEQIYSVENEIKKQFFPREYMIIKIYEKFVLSEQYNPEKLIELYRESILMEIRECDHMLYTMFRQADIRFPTDNTMELVLEDSVIAKSKEDELIGILDKVLNERCGFQVKFQTAYKEAKASKYREDDELRIRKIVEGISSRFGANSRGNDVVAASEGTMPAVSLKPAAVKSASEPVKAAAPPAQKEVQKSYGRFEKSGDKSFQKRALKRSDNPNVIFGRDFEDECINIEEIWGEMGEVTIRGKVRALETREIRNERT